MRDRKSQYHELLRAYFDHQKEEEFSQNCTFQPKINQSSQCRFYFYQSGSAPDERVKANVVKRNELWKECKEKKLEVLKKERQVEVEQECTFKPSLGNKGI